jgi:hypothetical protein
MLWIVMTVGTGLAAACGHRRLPVVGVEHGEFPALHRAAGKVRRCPAERGEPPPVVRPVLAARVAVRTALAAEQARRVEHQQRMARKLAGEQPRGFAQQRIPRVDLARAAHALDHGRVARQQGRYRDAVRRDGAGQGADDIG